MRTPFYRRSYTLLASLAFIATVAPPASAAPPPGRLLASQCSQCHGTNGNAISGFPVLAGRPASGTYQKLLNFKYNPRPTSIMDYQPRAYTDAQLRLIADYFATQ
jgi:cytochrome c553